MALNSHIFYFCFIFLVLYICFETYNVVLLTVSSPFHFFLSAAVSFFLSAAVSFLIAIFLLSRYIKDITSVSVSRKLYFF